MNGGHDFGGRYQFAAGMNSETITSCYAQVAADACAFERLPENGTQLGRFGMTLHRRGAVYDVATMRWHWPDGSITAIGFRVSRS
jgi:hypothetical protein